MLFFKRRPKFLPKSREAVRASEANLASARDNARAGRFPLAGADLVVAGEEAARAWVFLAVAKGVVVTDRTRVTPIHPYVDLSELERDHSVKYEWLNVIAVLQMIFRFAYSMGRDGLVNPGSTETEVDAFMRREYSSFMTLQDILDHLEELRQGRYSGQTTKGTLAPMLDATTFNALAEVIEDELGLVNLILAGPEPPSRDVENGERLAGRVRSEYDRLLAEGVGHREAFAQATVPFVAYLRAVGESHRREELEGKGSD